MGKSIRDLIQIAIWDIFSVAWFDSSWFEHFFTPKMIRFDSIWNFEKKMIWFDLIWNLDQINDLSWFDLNTDNKVIWFVIIDL